MFKRISLGLVVLLSLCVEPAFAVLPLDPPPYCNVTDLNNCGGTYVGARAIVADGATATDCSIGGGTDEHWCYYNSKGSWVPMAEGQSTLSSELGIVNGYFTERSFDGLRSLPRIPDMPHKQKVHFSAGAIATGTVTSATVNSVTVAGTPYEPGAFVRYSLRVNGQTGQFSPAETRHKITSNTSSVITFNPPLYKAPVAGDTFIVYQGLQPPGDDAGDGSYQRPYQSFDLMDDFYDEPVVIVLDCDDFITSRDSGPDFDGQIDNNGLTPARCPDGYGRLCNHITTLKACDAEEQWYARIDFDQANHSQGIINHTAPGVCSGFENISFGPHAYPVNDQDIYRAEAVADHCPFVGNVMFEGLLGFMNQGLTGHSTDASGIVRNSFAVLLDEQAFAAGCSADNVYQFDTFVAADVTAATDTINLPSHTLVDGQRIQFATDGTLPAPLVAGTYYYVGYVDANNIQPFTDFARNDIVDLTNGGSGNHSIQRLASDCDGPASISGDRNQQHINFAVGSWLISNAITISQTTDMLNVQGVFSGPSEDVWIVDSVFRQVTGYSGGGIRGLGMGFASGVDAQFVALNNSVFVEGGTATDDRCIEWNLNGISDINLETYFYKNTCIGVDTGMDGARNAGTNNTVDYWEACNAYDDISSTWWRFDGAISTFSSMYAVDVITDDTDAASSVRVGTTFYSTLALALADSAQGDLLIEQTPGNVFFNDAGSLATISEPLSGSIVPNEGLCISDECQRQCSYAFQLDFPQPEWQTMQIDLVGAHVKGWSIPKGSDKGASPSGSFFRH